MDRDFVAKLERVVGKQKTVFSIGNNTFFRQEGDRLLITYTTDSGETIEHTLSQIEQLLEGNAIFISSDDDWQDRYLPLLMAIETAIDSIYQRNPSLKDKVVITSLDRLIMKPSINIEDELIRAVQNNLRLALSTEVYSKGELLGCLRKVQRSAKRHHSVDGPTGYLDFIKDKV
jgi:hypothetical protein